MGEVSWVKAQNKKLGESTKAEPEPKKFPVQASVIYFSSQQQFAMAWAELLTAPGASLKTLTVKQGVSKMGSFKSPLCHTCLKSRRLGE